jgi:hypothetical protein
VTDGDATFLTTEDIPGPDSGVDEAEDPIARDQVGEVINGIVISDGQGGVKSVCPEATLSDSAARFEAKYLPANTFERAYPQFWTCVDGSLSAAFFKYSIGAHGFSIFSINYIRVSGEARAIATGPVEAIFINGQPGVAVSPSTFEGKEIGQGSVVFLTKNGAIEVIGVGLPLEETIKIAEGIQCEDC